MKKRLFEFVLILFLMGFVLAADATETVINFGGCNFQYDGELFSVSLGSCSGGDAPGLFYCGLFGEKYYTTQDSYGCSRGSTTGVPEDFCCPSGMFCNSTTFLCEQRIDNCFSFEDPDDCKEVGCFWMDGVCVDSKSDYDCGYYANSTACANDDWNLGEEGLGTEHCHDSFQCEGVDFYVDGCSCEWDATDGVCQTASTAKQLASLGVQNSFVCMNDYELDPECVDGVQGVNWTSSAEGIVGFEDGVPDECLAEIGCLSGAGERFCGEELIKLPFFSGFSFVVALGLIFLFYFFRRE